MIRGLSSSPTHMTSTPFRQQGYVSTQRQRPLSDAAVLLCTYEMMFEMNIVCVFQAKLMSECSGSINSVKRVKLILNDEEELEETGLTSSTADKQTSTGKTKQQTHSKGWV